MKKILVCLLVLNICVFSFSGLFVVNAAIGSIDLSNLPTCKEGDTNCRIGSYVYLSSKPSAGKMIQSTINGNYRFLRTIYFKGTGTLTFYDENNKERVVPVSSVDRIGLYVFNSKFVKFKYEGLDLLGVYFSYNRAGFIVCYDVFTYPNQDYYGGKGNIVDLDSLPPLVDEGGSSGSSLDKSILDLIGKIEELIAELKKKDCDVCKKLDAILADTDAMNNNISRLKITTGYINSHVSNISTKLDSTNTHLDGIGTDIGYIKGSVEQSADFLEQISNKVDSLESIDSKLDSLEDIKGGITDIGNSLIPSTVPDFSAVVNKPDLPVLDIPNLSKQQDTNIYFFEKAFVGESESLPFAPEPKNWTDFNNKSLDLDEFERDEPLEQDEFEREKFERDEPLERDEFEREKFERDDPLERDEFEREKFERDDPLERDRPLERDEPLGG